MMKKTGAGVLWFGVGVFVLGGCWMGVGGAALAQDVAQSPKVAPSTMAAPILPDVPESDTVVDSATAEDLAPLPPPSERLEALKTADLATLKAAREDCIKAAQAYSEKIPELRQQAQAAYEEARLNSPEAQALRQQIADLEAKLAQTLRDAPAVREKQLAIGQAEQDMLAELQLRTTLGGMIAQKGGGDVEAEPEAEAETAE